MTTPYENLYSRFLSKITDYDHDSMDSNTLNDLILGYLKGALPKFIDSRTSLTRDDDTSLFSETLSELEEEIIASMMIIEWLNPRINFSDLLEKYLSPKDFNDFSPANQLKEIKSLRTTAQGDVDTLIIKYSYNTDLSELS